MPIGVQQAMQGLLCVGCDGVLVEGATSGISTYLCETCEVDFSHSCDSCGYEGLSESLVPWERQRAFSGNSIWLTAFYCAQDTGEMVCHDCVYSCDNCGETYQDEQEYLGCCNSGSDSIHCYSYRPTPYFYVYRDDEVIPLSMYEPGVLYMGAEIEIAKMADLVDDFLENCTRDESDFLYFKEDASIGDYGAELVTMPATLEAFERIFPFDALDAARDAGARSFYYPSCGFHIHVSRTAFTATHMWKFVRFQLMNPGLCQRVAQRTESSYATWYYDEREERDIPEYVKGVKSNGRRYLAINFQNHNTVELRYFKGNILRGAIMKNMEFVQSMYDYTKSLTVRDVMNGSLKERSYMLWLAEQDAYPNLKSFLDNDSNEGDS